MTFWIGYALNNRARQQIFTGEDAETQAEDWFDKNYQFSPAIEAVPNFESGYDYPLLSPFLDYKSSQVKSTWTNDKYAVVHVRAGDTFVWGVRVSGLVVDYIQVLPRYHRLGYFKGLLTCLDKIGPCAMENVHPKMFSCLEKQGWIQKFSSNWVNAEMNKKFFQGKVQ